MSSTVNLDRPDVPLIKCMVHFIGRAAPFSSSDGIEAIQKPLSEMYARDGLLVREVDMPRDSYLVALTSGLFLLPVNPLDKPMWLRINELRSCAAVKAVQDNNAVDEFGNKLLSFLPLDTIEAKVSQLPPIFTCIMGRSNGLPLTDCYAFVCQSDETALALVETTKKAFANRSGWSTSLKPPNIKLQDLDNNQNNKLNRNNHDDDDDEKVEFGRAQPEMFDKPPLNGFFYSPRPDLVRKYYIGVEAECPPVPNVVEVLMSAQCSYPCQPPPVQQAAPIQQAAPVQPPAPVQQPAPVQPPTSQPENVFVTVNQMPITQPQQSQTPQVMIPYDVYLQLLQQQQQPKPDDDDDDDDESDQRSRSSCRSKRRSGKKSDQPGDNRQQNVYTQGQPTGMYAPPGPPGQYPQSQDNYPNQMYVSSPVPLPQFVAADQYPPPPGMAPPGSLELQQQPGLGDTPQYDAYGYMDQLPLPDARYYPQYPDDPRLAQYPDDPRFAQYPDDPRLAQYQDPRLAQYPDDPRLAQYQDDPRLAQYQDDPRLAQYPDDPRLAQYQDPRLAQYQDDPRLAQYPDDPRLAQYPSDPRYPATQGDLNPYLMPQGRSGPPPQGPQGRSGPPPQGPIRRPPQGAVRPPPTDNNLPPGAVPFDSNFILQRSDMDMDRLAREMARTNPYRVPVDIGY